MDHVSTLEDSFRFWEEQEYDTTDGKKASIVFKVVSERTDANVWVTWVVRSLGEGVLGHANLGKGVVEVAIGNYSCDGTAHGALRKYTSPLRVGIGLRWWTSLD